MSLIGLLFSFFSCTCFANVFLFLLDLLYTCIFVFRPNTSLSPLSFMFVSDRSFKFLTFQICSLSFEFVSDMSFKFLRFQIGPLSLEFVSDRSFLSTSVEPKLICPLSQSWSSWGKNWCQVLERTNSPT